MLCAVAKTLKGMARQSDTLVRYGGEEFVALLPETEGPDAMALAERMRNAVVALDVQIDATTNIRVTLSLGVASYPADAADGETLVQRGDAAMYTAEQNRRHRTVGCATAQSPLPTRRILLVDNSDQSLKLLEAYLVSEGCQCFTAVGVEATGSRPTGTARRDHNGCHDAAADRLRRLSAT